MTESLQIQLAAGTVLAGACALRRVQFPAIPVGLVSPTGIAMDAFESRETRCFAVFQTPEEVLKGQVQTLERPLLRLGIESGQSGYRLAPLRENLALIGK